MSSLVDSSSRMSNNRWKPVRFSPVKFVVSPKISSMVLDRHCAAQYSKTGIVSCGCCLAEVGVVAFVDVDLIKFCLNAANREGWLLLFAFPLLKKFISKKKFVQSSNLPKLGPPHTVGFTQAILVRSYAL